MKQNKKQQQKLDFIKNTAWIIQVISSKLIVIQSKRIDANENNEIPS